MKIRRANERGHAQHGWLDSHHTFSFAGYYDPRHMGFGPLRVINDDRVAPGAGFGTHPHRDMEIISYVVEGALEHRDSMGHGSTIRPGDVQRMSAGTGVRHSEYNHDPANPVRFLQIWIEPREKGLAPSYAQHHFGDERLNRLRLVVAPDGEDGALTVAQDVRLYASVLGPDHELTHDLAAGRKAWLQVVRGTLVLNGEALHEGDGAALTEPTRLTMHTHEAVELILFDMEHSA